ncbi:hypothetical protein [Brevundimonas sp.]|uniref:hypothetical protein n=1 Tax=Brevundimonas sp. TaxID=1871086 RepID=UPI00272F4454|nr:hypothetical protein [Brevundimonas sp.]MDP1911780.1 hypothetical protein [Brevundimonas sp.]
MIYFLILPLWILGLLGCGFLALFKPVRVLAAYLALMGTVGVWLSFALSTLALVAPAWIDLPFDSSVGGILLIGGYLAGMAGGGILGTVLGALLARKLTGKRPIISRPA